jgi:phosphohistidine phosphatase
MKLLVIRHAIAEDREEFARTGRPDALRPLTDEGRKRMRRAARGLRRVAPQIGLLAASPLTRAVQTADILAQEYRGVERVRVPELAPEEVPDALVPWLRQREAGSVVAVVGHEPHLGFLLGWLLTGRHQSFVELKKGAACMLEFDDPPAAGNAVLLWSLPPSHLRLLGEKKG